MLEPRIGFAWWIIGQIFDLHLHSHVAHFRIHIALSLSLIPASVYIPIPNIRKLETC